MSGQIDGSMLIARALNGWGDTRAHTIDLLNLLTEDELVAKFPRPLFNTFGKHFQELGVIQKSYANAILTGKINFAEMSFEFDPKMISSKSKTLSFLTKVNKEFTEAVNSQKDYFKIIDWGLPDNPNLLEHIYWLNTHEVLHQGQLSAYCYLLNIDIPESWVNSWAFPPKDPEGVRQWLKKRA